MKTLNVLPQDDARQLYKEIERRTHPTPRRFADELRFYRVLLEDLYKAVCAAHDRWFADLHARMVYVATVHDLPPSVNQELHGLRRIANGVSHNNLDVNETQYLSATKVLCEGIAFLSSLKVPASILVHYEKKHTTTLIVPPNRKYTTHAMDRSVVIKAEQARDGKNWILTCESEFDLGQYTLLLKDHSMTNKAKGSKDYNFEADFTQLGPMIPPFAKIHAFNISRDEHQEDRYHTFHESMIVLEPDLLVDVSTIAKCYLDHNKEGGTGPEELNLLSHPQWGLVQKLRPVPMNEHLLTGNVANSLLDAWLKEGQPEWDDEISKAIQAAPWDAIRVGESKLQTMRNQLKGRHVKNFNSLPKRKEGERDVIEPTFYSVRYGLFGRLDCLRESTTIPNKKEIFELKSGKPAAVGTKPEHQMQAIGYHMLMRSVTRGNAATTAAVFYSAAESQPLRNVTTSRRLEQHLSMTRSLYVAEMLHMASGNPEIYQEPRPVKAELPWYTELDMQQLPEKYSNASELEQDYVREFNAFMLRELLHQKVGDTRPRDGHSGSTGFSALWRLSPEEKLETYSLIDGLRYRSTDPADPNVVIFDRHSDGNQPYASFREGDMALLYPEIPEESTKPGKPYSTSALRHQVFKGTITQVSTGEVRLRLMNPQADHEVFQRHAEWCIERDIMESSIFNMMQSTTALLGFEEDKRNVFMGLRPPRFDTAPPIDLTQIAKTFTASQSEAIQGALSAKDFMLIQGPPGTGKTSRVLAEIVLQTYKNTSQVVFLLAFTNRAVDKVLESIRALAEDDPAHNIPLLRLTSRPDDPDGLAVKAQGLTPAEVERLIAQTRVYVATISSYLRMQGNLPASIPRDTLIIDEASQVLEPHVAGIIPAFNKFILIGDHKQLPPIVLQPEATCRTQSSLLRNAKFRNMRTSIFERLWEQAMAQVRKSGTDAHDWQRSMVMLREHFRMHEAIARHVNPNYGGKLQIGKPKEQQAAFPRTLSKNPLERLLTTHRVLFFESPAGDQRIHPFEATMVLHIVQALQSVDPQVLQRPDGIGIITPWRAQISCILKELAHAGINGVPVDTVERFQGSECDNIIVSLSTSNEGLLSALCASVYGSGSSEVDRKLNVTLSRAKSRLILLGEPAVLSENPHYHKLIRAIQQQGGFISNSTSTTYTPAT